MRTYNRYGCVPSVRCHCPRSFATCSGWQTLYRLADEGNRQAIEDLRVAKARVEADKRR